MSEVAAIRNDAVGLRAGVLAMMMAMLWGGNSVAIKIGLEGMPPAAMAALRFVLGALTVWVGALFVGVSLAVPRGMWKGLAGLGLLFTVQIWLLNAGTGHTTASRSGVLINVYPFFLALFSHLFVPGDRINFAKAIGLAFSFSGVALLFAESISLADTDYLLGDSMVALSGMLLGLRQVVLKRLVQGLHPFQVLFWQASLSLPLFALWSVFVEGDAHYVWNAEVILAVLYQGVVVAGLCFVILVFLIRHHSASRLGVFSFVTPVVGVLLSAWLLDEQLSPVLLISLGLVALGIVVTNRVERSQETKLASAVE
ncbi:MAG: drug/metabolite transporter (DMT)-like permease [Candidatus Latescibacterota bacterium]|jgi:drug/metabolite transporter (DMT)-like permease